MTSSSQGNKVSLSLVANVVPRSAGAVVGLGAVLRLGLLVGLLGLLGGLLLLGLVLLLSNRVVDVGDRGGLSSRGRTRRGASGSGGELRKLENELEDALGADLLVDCDLSVFGLRPNESRITVALV